MMAERGGSAGVASLVIAAPEHTQGPAHRRSGAGNQRLFSWLVILVPLGVVLVGAWSYRWVQEDAFINFRIIGNLLAGHGPVFNVGERVEAYSDPLWLALVSVVHEVLPF